MAVDWVYETLPNVELGMTGNLFRRPGPDFEDDKKRSHFDQYLNWRIDEKFDEFVIRIARKPEAGRRGHINVDVKIEGGLSEQPDGSVRFDGGLQGGRGACKFALSFEISPVEFFPEDVEPEVALEEPEDKEIKFFDHPEHKLRLARENYYSFSGIGSRIYTACFACKEPITGASARWVYECPNKPDCDYCVHAKCAQMANTIRHPSHLQHPLKLRKLEPGFVRDCNVCKADISCGLHYSCAKCDFDLHCECPNPAGDGYSHGNHTRAMPQTTPQASPQAFPRAMPQSYPQATPKARPNAVQPEIVAQSVAQSVALQRSQLELQRQMLQQHKQHMQQLELERQRLVLSSLI